MNQEIDIVLPWVNGSDPQWREEKNKYLSIAGLDTLNLGSSASRYRDWENLHFIFRGIEKFAPWVRKVHFITEGHLPEWLDESAPGLNIVKHSDYMPAEYLPTFSSHPIELNIHRIDELSEKFIYFNDDTFIISHLREDDFFRDNKPCGMAVNTRIESSNYNDPIAHIGLNDIAIINQNFSKSRVLKSNFSKWLHYSYGLKYLLRSLLFTPFPTFTGLLNPHIPPSFLKSTFEEVWKKEFDILHKVSKNKFRSKDDVNQYLMQDWQLASGNFWPKNLYKDSAYFGAADENADALASAIYREKYKIICINDSDKINDFETVKNTVNRSLLEKLPDKSRFEK